MLNKIKDTLREWCISLKVQDLRDEMQIMFWEKEKLKREIHELKEENKRFEEYFKRHQIGVIQ